MKSHKLGMCAPQKHELRAARAEMHPRTQIRGSQWHSDIEPQHSCMARHWLDLPHMLGRTLRGTHRTHMGQTGFRGYCPHWL